jgi:hypothetical protein
MNNGTIEREETFESNQSTRSLIGRRNREDYSRAFSNIDPDIERNPTPQITPFNIRDIGPNTQIIINARRSTGISSIHRDLNET